VCSCDSSILQNTASNPPRIVACSNKAKGKTISKTGEIQMARSTGTVKWFNSEKGFGFVTQENGPDLFVHYSEIQSNGYRSLNEGDKVEFDITDGKKGKQASAVTVIK